MTYKIIATGSTGNAVLINDQILVDCGVTFKKIEPYLPQIRLILTTHRHSDHFKPSTVGMITKRRPAIRWGCCEWMVEPLIEAGVNRRQIDVYEPGYYYDYQDFRLKAVTLRHNVPNCGYKIHDLKTDERLFYATDTGDLDGIDAEDYDLYLIEANHSTEELTERIKEKLEAGEYTYEYAAAENHLSKEQAIDWIVKNAGPHSHIQFLHQHKGESHAEQTFERIDYNE